MSKDKDSLRPAKLIEYGEGSSFFANRTVTRTQGCWNCLHSAGQTEVEVRFTAMTGLVAGQEKKLLLVQETMTRQLQRQFNRKLGELMSKTRLTEAEAVDQLLKEKVIREGSQGYMALGAMIADKKVTYCKINATTTPGAFVPMAYLCGDSKGSPCKYVAMAGAAEARAPGQAPDKPFDEAYDDVEHDVVMRNRKLIPREPSKTAEEKASGEIE